MNKGLKIGLIVASAIAVLVLLILVFTIGGNDTTTNGLSDDPSVILANAEVESAAVKEEEMADFIEIDTNTYLSYYAGSEAKIILLARPTCHYCTIAEPILHKVAKDYNLEINYLNPDNFTAEDQTAFVGSDEEFKEGYGTPFLFIVRDNQIIDKVDGLTDTAHYIYFFQVNDYIR